MSETSNMNEEEDVYYVIGNKHEVDVNISSETYYVIGKNYAVDINRLSISNMDINTMEIPDPTFKADLTEAISLFQKDPKQFVKIFKKYKEGEKKSPKTRFRESLNSDLSLNGIEQQLSNIMVSLKDIPEPKPGGVKNPPYAELEFTGGRCEIEEPDSQNYYDTTHNITTTTPAEVREHSTPVPSQKQEGDVENVPPIPRRPGSIFITPKRRKKNHTKKDTCYIIFMFFVLLVGILNVIVYLHILLVAYDLSCNIPYLLLPNIGLRTRFE